MAGHINWDVTLRLDTLPRPDGEAKIFGQYRGGGGSAANVAALLVDLSTPAGLIGSVGEDDLGDRVCSELRDRGVDLEHVTAVAGETTVKYLLVDTDGDVAVLGNDGVNEALTPEDVSQSMVTDAAHLHLTNQRPATARTLARMASEDGLTVSFDPGRRAGERAFGPVLEHVDILFGTQEEVQSLTPLDRSEALNSDMTVVIKRGADGAATYACVGNYDHPGFDVDAIDTSGAGDAFAAGYLASWHSDGDHKRALDRANACGALACLRRGARVTLEQEAIESILE